VPRRPPLIAAAAGLILAAGCGGSGPVRITPPQPPASVVAQCEALDRLLPAKLVGLDGRRTSPKSSLTRAWGTPAITLTCGAPKPAGYRPTSSSTLAVDNVLWFETVQGNKVTWTAIRGGHGGGPTVFVALAVPRAYPAAEAFLTTLAAPLKAAIPR
jgi:hypothetical protein